METSQLQEPRQTGSTSSNKILINGIITGVLILLMLIPMVFIFNLVQERQERHEEISREVSSKWATAQTLSGPYLYIPYKSFYKTSGNKLEEIRSYYWLAPEELSVNGRLDHQVRKRSIYKVLLYTARLSNSGNFVLQAPADVDSANILWKEAKICFGLGDFKGVEQRISVTLNGKEYELSPGLPANDISKTGLSAPVDLSPPGTVKTLPFAMQISLRGSEQLHFLPLSGNSQFSLQSSWPNPSFDGSSLPGERKVTQQGFTAKWNFNKANLFFGTMLRDFKFEQLDDLAFGITMLQPADQYAKTSRCAKYAILFIGLTFSLFFIIELTQRKPVHPVQYMLIGLALVIFYSLLLSLSEFILFDYAYLIAAAAIIIMITLYAYNHFKKWSSAMMFCGVLTTLYGFIFILISLEDTALLVGSIGLFIVLALVMYGSRKVKWYGAMEN